MDKERILKYVKGGTSGLESQDILDWVDEDAENAKSLHSMKADYVFDTLPYKVMDKNLHSKVMRRLRRPIPFKNIIVKAAAILFIPLALYTIYEQFLSTEDSELLSGTRVVIPAQKQITMLYRVNAGVKGLVNLPDGSRVWLNSNSSLSCPDKFDSLSRIVELDGEGYFYVESNKDWPMYVKTKKGITVKVLGTEFNLSSYGNDNELKFTLVSGKATLIRESTNQEISVNIREEVIIPDDVRISGKKGAAHIRLNTGWKDGLLIFEDTPMAEVVKKMERWYGVNFIIKDPDILSYCFTGTFSSESITQVLELLKITSNIGYSIKDKNVTLFFR
jgi:hypothetical protein